MRRRPPDPHEYYLDANLDGPEVVQRLRDGGMVCHAHRDHFECDAADEDWIPPIAAKRWVIVTRDVEIQRNPTERDAWMAAEATVIMVRGDRLSAQDMAEMLLEANANGRLDAYISKRLPPMIIHLHAGGRFQVRIGGERRGGRKKE